MHFEDEHAQDAYEVVLASLHTGPIKALPEELLRYIARLKANELNKRGKVGALICCTLAKTYDAQCRPNRRSARHALCNNYADGDLRTIS